MLSDGLASSGPNHPPNKSASSPPTGLAGTVGTAVPGVGSLAGGGTAGAIVMAVRFVSTGSAGSSPTWRRSHELV
jgi:hypothetical protein